MPDDVFYDAINLFKFSETGQGRPRLNGSDHHRNRYSVLAHQVVDRLWYLWARDAIVYEPMRRGITGDSPGSHATDRDRQQIRVSTDYRDNLPVTLVIIVHEAVHCVCDWRRITIEEILCKSLEALYMADLFDIPHTHRMRSRGGTTQTVQLTRATAPPDFDPTVRAMRNGRMIDLVLETGDMYVEERYGETPNLDATWVREVINWWGGIANRRPVSKGYFIRGLSRAGQDSDAELIVRILESMDRGDCEAWRTMQNVVRDWEPTRRILSSVINRLASQHLAARIFALQDHWGVELAVPLGSRRPRC